MSDGIKRMYEDIEEFAALQIKAKLRCKEMYSREAFYLEKGFKEHGYTADELQEYIKLCVALEKLDAKNQVKKKELKLLADLKAKYE